VDDFQDVSVWRALARETAAGLIADFGRPLIVPMTLLNPAHFDEIVGSLARLGLEVRHLCLYGTPIHASAGGVVIFAGWYGGYGNFVIVDHGDGIATAYAHQSQIAVSQGQTVSQGDVLGDEGSTGDSTGPHVHFEVRVNGSPQNPRDYVPGSP
jgi:hypothetical protein